MNETEVDELFGQANALLGAGRFEEAMEVLRTARDRAAADKDCESEAFFSSIAGSFLASRARDQEALEEYSRAESRDPSSPAWRVATANHLLNLGEAAKARDKAQEVLVRGRGTSSYEHVGYSLLGLAQFALGDEVAAADAFAASADPGRVHGLPASGLDLRLAEALLITGTARALVRSYLRDALLKAQAEGNEALEARIHQLEERLDASP